MDWGTTLNGDLPPTEVSSIAQRNLGVLPVWMRFRYPVHVWNHSDKERQVVVEARQAPLSELAAFHRGFPGGEKMLERQGKVENMGIFTSANPDRPESEDIIPIPSHITIAPRSCRKLMLCGDLQKDNALIHVTQTLDGRVVGGLSVLAMTEKK